MYTNKVDVIYLPLSRCILPLLQLVLLFFKRCQSLQLLYVSTQQGEGEVQLNTRQLGHIKQTLRV